MVRAVVFDLDGTLHDRQTCVRNCIENQFRRFETELAHVTLPDFRLRFDELEERGYVPKTIVYERMGIEFGFSPALRHTLSADYYLQYPRFCVGFPLMKETVRELRAGGRSLAIVTNASTAFQHAAIAALGIAQMFDAIVISEAEGVRKPDRRIFDLTLARLGIAPADAIFVGDHPEVDIRGAQAAGMRAIWKRDDYWETCPHADAVISELDELPRILDQMDLSPA